MEKTVFIKIFVVLGLLVSVFSQTVKPQTENPFVTHTGGFSINLPHSQGGGGNGTAGGINFTWRQSEAEYQVGFYEIEGLPLAKINGEFSFEQMVKQYFNKFSAKGERIYAKEIVLGENAGREYKYKTGSAVFILRLYSVGDRIYKILAEIPLKNQSSEAKVLRTFDSFQLLDDAVVKAAIAKKLSDATPKELPQSPVVAKLKSDAHDRNLKGTVKSVLTQMALYGVDNALRKPKPNLLEEFDRNGRLTKQIEFDSYGNPNNVRVFGYVAGKRVSRVGHIAYEYEIGGVSVDFQTSAKPDERFDESYDYRYAGNNLIQERIFWNNGWLNIRFGYRYLKGKKETITYGEGNLPFRKIISAADDKGNEIEMIFYEYEGRKTVEKKRFKIDYMSFDEKGNWTKRTNSTLVEFGGTKKSFPEFDEHRTIIYYE